jgi:hypothetical protein
VVFHPRVERTDTDRTLQSAIGGGVQVLHRALLRWTELAGGMDNRKLGQHALNVVRATQCVQDTEDTSTRCFTGNKFAVNHLPKVPVLELSPSFMCTGELVDP